MWDKPELLRMISTALFGICFVLVLYGALHYALHLPIFALRIVSITTTPRQVVPAQIEAVARHELRGNFFTVDLDHTRRAFESIPWVRKVSMRRHFPWRLEISLEEHVALAHWNDAGLVNTRGEVFSAETGQQLPNFIGQPDGAAEITQMYAELTEQLAPLKQGIAEISLSPRRSWQLRLNNGMLLKLGREQSKQRLARFVAVYPYSLMPMQQNDKFFHTGKAPHENGLQHGIEYVDLRYSNGFAAYLSGTNGLGMAGKKSDIGRS
ncbi:MAG: cell division protein FtsQ/DivIB [Candidatus Nitrotoga sp.]